MCPRCGFIVLGVVVVVFPCASLLRAQDHEGAEPVGPLPLHVDADTADVYINDSFEAADAIAKARRLAGAGRWAEAAELLQRTADAADDKLVRLSPRYYVGIREHVSNLIAGWPESGVQAYRALFESQMNAALREASGRRSMSEYLTLFDRFFCTASAGELADAIGQLALESGDLVLAERVYGRVLADHPDKATYAERYRAMLTLIRAMGGEGPFSLTESDARQEIRWMGEDRQIGDLVADLRRFGATTRDESSSPSWPIFGGNAERHRAVSSAVDELGLRWRFAQFGRQRRRLEGRDDDSFLSGAEHFQRLTLHPVVSGNLVYVQHYREVVALHRNTGVLAWRYHADAGTSSGYSDFEDQVSGWDSVTVQDGWVYVALPGDVVDYYGYESAQTPPELICLDAATGRVVWPVDREAFMQQFVEVRFDSTPLVRQGRLYVVGRRRRSFGFEDCYLYRFNATDGRLESRTHLGSASTGTFGSQRATTAIAAMHGDTVYVCTNLGTIAAVSAHTGAVRWLRLYERDSADQRRDSSWIAHNLDPWAFNPVIWAGGRIVCLPTDSPNVFVLAQDDGRLLRSIPVSELGKVETLLGVQGNIVCGVGVETACYDLALGKTLWSSPLAVGTEVWGRGVWVDERLLVPTREGLSSFRVADGQRTDLAWDTGGTGGNLVALPDQLLVAGAGTISAYVRKADIWRGLRERMAEAPSDPLPALELAEVALQGGEWAEAIRVLDEAVGRAGAFMEPIEPGLKRRFFDDLIMFVDVLSTGFALDKDTLEKLFTYASQCPPDTAAHVVYRFRFAELFEEGEEPDRALRLYQQVLRDRSLRDQPAARSATGGETAAARAQRRIADLIDRFGAEIYAPHEEEARQWLDGARATADDAGLQRVVETFPNSKAAPVALVSLGELMAQRDRPAEAAAHFARAYHRYPEQVNRPSLLRMIADAYEKAGRLESAYLWLTKAAREHPSVLIEHAGRRVTFLDYRERLASVRDTVEPSRPKIEPPLSQPFVREFEEEAVLLVSWFGAEPGSDWSHYFVRTPAGIQAFHARTNIPSWEEPAPVRSTPELLAATSDVAVFATKYEVFALDISTGHRRWSHGEYPAAIDRLVGDWENGKGYRTHAMQGGRLVTVREDGLLTCVTITDGEVQWSETHRPTPTGRLRLAAPWLVYHGTREGESIIRVIHASTGVQINTITINEPRPVEDFFVTLDGQLIVVTSRSVLAYDVETGAPRWRGALDGHLRPATLVPDLDALYLSDDGRSIRKISLAGGHVLWQSEELVRRGEEELTVQRQGGNVILSTTASIAAVDAVTGLTLWRGTTPDLPRFVGWFVTASYVMAVDVGDELEDGQGTAYFYDHRNASGLIPRDGGACNLGRLEKIRAILVADGALLIQTGSTVRGWTE